MKTDTTLSRRRLLASVPAVAAIAAPATAAALSGLPASAATSPNDPIFAAIAAHQVAVKEWQACPESLACGDKAEIQSNQAFAYAFDTFDRLMEVTPTTVAGVAAWLHYLGSPYRDGTDETVGEYFAEEFNEVLARQHLAAAEVLRKTAA